MGADLFTYRAGWLFPLGSVDGASFVACRMGQRPGCHLLGLAER